MNRNSHLFQFSAAAISHAASREAKYHDERIAFWFNEQTKPIAQAKEAGVEVREYEVTGGVNVDVVIDPTVSKRLSECASKIKSHQQAKDRFLIEAAAYKSQVDLLYELDPDDVVYFRLAGGARED